MCKVTCHYGCWLVLHWRWVMLSTFSYAHLYVFFEKSLFRSFDPFLISWFLLLSYMTLCILNINSLSDILFASIFSHFAGFFNFVVSLLCRSYLVWYNLHLFLLLLFAFGCPVLKTHYQEQWHFIFLYGSIVLHCV